MNTNASYKHVEIRPHPLREGRYMVHNGTFPSIPPFFGTLRQCIKAAAAAEANSQKMLDNLVRKEREKGEHTEEEIQQAVKERLNWRKRR